jgi:hypothetical protein
LIDNRVQYIGYLHREYSISQYCRVRLLYNQVQYIVYLPHAERSGQCFL